MAPRMIQYDDTIDFIWGEGVYSEAKLLADPRAADLAPRMAHIIASIEAVRSGLYGVWREEIVAQAHVDSADEHLDEVVDGTGKALDRAVDGDHNDPRWKRYIGNSNLSKIKSQGLETEVKTVRTWPESLASEPEQSLQKQGVLVADAITRGGTAITARETATGHRRDFMARDKAQLVDAFNDLRLDLYADLTKRVVANRLDRSWPDSFFRKAAAKAAAPEPTPPAPPQPA